MTAVGRARAAALAAGVRPQVIRIMRKRRREVEEAEARARPADERTPLLAADHGAAAEPPPPATA